MGGVCAQLLTDIDPKIASQMGPRRRKNAEAMWKSGMKSRPLLTPIFFFLRNNDITKKKKKAKQNSQNKQK